MATATAPIKIELDYSDGLLTSMVCASGTTISKYAVLTLTSPNTAATVADTPLANGYVCAGIAAMTKSSADASTTITVWKRGYFEAIASGAITVGSPVKSCGSGYFKQAVAADVASGAICGYARSTGVDNTAFQMRLEVMN